MPPWLRAVDASLAKSGALLTPDFAIKVAKAVLTRAPHMAERDVVDALNKCQSMAAKAQLLSHKGVSKHENSVEVWRKFLAGELDENLESVADLDEEKETKDGEAQEKRIE